MKAVVMATMIWIACGGTGGHLFPGLALAEEFKNRGADVRLFLSTKKVDAQAMEAFPGFEAVQLPVIGWPGVNLRLAKFGYRFGLSYLRCVRRFEKERPKAVLGMGGFLSAPPILAALKLGIPAFLHESNVIPGRVTRWLGPKVKTVFTGFKKCEIAGAKTVHVGTPLRPGLKHMGKSTAAQVLLNVDDEKNTLLVMGGSQGARGLNAAILQAAQFLQYDWRKWQVLHLTGLDGMEWVMRAYEELNLPARVIPFCDRMDAVYALADLVVSRAGASSLNEISYYGLPSLLVPFPHAADNHQFANAQVYADHGAAKILDERTATEKDFARVIHGLMQNGELRKEMGNHAKELFVDASAMQIVQEVERAIA